MQTEKPISRQRQWQLRQIAKGLCIICPAPAVINRRCLKHHIVAREAQRRRKGATTRHTKSKSYQLEEKDKTCQK